MFKKSLALTMITSLMGGLSLPSMNAPTPARDISMSPTKSKGQIRNAKPKASGVARMKRQAKKANNIRKRS